MLNSRTRDFDFLQLLIGGIRSPRLQGGCERRA